ncbi:MAG: hypothetical protein KC619_26035 [Myxococcales bacterium]|nr:hypothetical protein [Myxococcales bacterium]
MERPSPETVAYYESALPDDPRSKPGQMFGHPCAYVNGNMFFGTFAQTVVARVGTERADELAAQDLRVFVPMSGRVWKEYVQVDRDEVPVERLRVLALEALEHTASLPPKAKKKAATKKAATKKAATKKAATKR